MLRKTVLARNLALAFSGVAAVGAIQAQQSTQNLERVEVTGSRIKRIEGETSNPVQVISREEIARSGATNVNDVLQRISGAGAGLDDRFTNGFAPGGGGVNLRGLGFNSTLVLINGRRTPTYPFAQQVGTAQGFNDLQNIPLAAVERVEILKDGASAIYGADAVAGVINIILRQDYRGLEASASVGQSKYGDGRTYELGVTGGYGALETDRFNVLIGVNATKSDEIKSRARPFSGTEDLRNAGGSDRRSSYGDPGTITDSKTGAKVFGAGCGPATQHSGSSVRAGFCRYDRPGFGSLLAGNERVGVYGKVNFAVTSSITAFLETLLTRDKFTSAGWPAGTTDDVGLGSNIIPIGNPVNPFPNDALVRYRFSDVGNRGNDGTSKFYRLVAGFKGSSDGWDWEVAGNANKIQIDNLATNNALNSHTLCLTNPQAAATYAAGGDPLGNGTLAQIFAANPAYATYFQKELAGCPAAFAKYGYYNYLTPSANAPGTAAFLRHDSTRQGLSYLYGGDARVSKELMPLPGGQLAFALGAETRYEKVSDIPDIQLQTGDTLAISAAQAFGSHHVSAAYAELVAPVTKELELSAALRYDTYSGNGSFAATSPKVGIRYQPFKSLLLRATASKAFRAPSLFETSPAQQTAFTFGIQDPVKCPTFDANNPDCVIDVRRVQQGNPALKAENSKAFTMGIVLEPTDSVTLSLDYWRINRRNEIGAFADQVLINAFPNDPNIVVRDAGGHIVQLNQVPVQLNSTSTYGVDAEVSFRNNLGDVGRLTSKIGASYVGSYKFTTLGDNGMQAETSLNGSYGQPRWRGQWDFDLTSGPWDFFVNGIVIGNYVGLGKTDKVGAFTNWNTGVVYSFSKNLSVNFRINNVFNRFPPFDDESNGGAAGYNNSYGDVAGRFYKVGATYKFF